MPTRSIAFMDESGILGGTGQRFFCLGLMKTVSSGLFSDAAHRVFDRAISCVPGAGPDFEFKFNSVTASSLPFHLELIDAYFSQPEYFFCALVMDKQRPGVSWQAHFGSVWDAYLNYAKVIVEDSIARDEEVFVIADYFGKPRRSKKYFESELCGCVGSARPNPGRVFNACMLDSCSSMAIQTVDLILGGVRRSFLTSRQPAVSHDAEKDAISARIQRHINRHTLAASFTRHGPQYFCVWELTP